MNFGTFGKSFCGICKIQEDGHFDKNNELVSDTICNSCSEDWIFYDEEETEETEETK